MKTTTARPSKSTGLAATYKRIADWQAKGRTVAVVSVNDHISLETAAKAGAKLARLLVSQPDTVEQGREIVTALRRSGAVDRCFILGFSL